MRMSGGVEKERSIRWANEELAELDVLEKVRLLDRKPCCLKCGSTNVEVIRRPDRETLIPNEVGKFEKRTLAVFRLPYILPKNYTVWMAN